MGSYIPNTGKEQLEMLKSMGYSSMDDLFAAIPDDMKLKDGLDLPEGKSELEVSRIMKGIATKNKVFSSIFRGAGDVYKRQTLLVSFWMFFGSLAKRIEPPSVYP